MMLVLSRKTGERVMINGEEIVITIVGVEGDRVRLGVSAPNTVSVHREEIFRRIKGEGRRDGDQGAA